ncbi:MAG: cell division protein FtsA [Sphaerochaetaceae bacterium]|nr:cell division protein FtsA [Sphaerochaetaceae bacterium]NLO61249.1 cell division protein FtsA [Spirochaetales bacterium]MDD2407119.1 cell division protein FtsA [Sphaerochaetaceae bacterium]MDD3670228.1 cell division protein FtsA [Sphaerochaetaceae bacterium]MDD4259103.1 cell division protein FtsA [Sphaerochaetaceae bacterium]
MAGDKIMMALDIGSSWVRAVIGSITREGTVMVDSICERPSEGVRAGAIVNIEQTLKSINSVITEAELQAGTEVQQLIIGIGGNHIEGIPSQGVVGINAKDQEIKREDIFRSLEVARAFELPLDREILHTLVQDFRVDGRDGIKDPIDMLGHRLESRVLVVTGSSSICQNERKCIQRSGFQVQRMVVQQIADAESVLSIEEKEMGTVLINIGGGITNMVVYANGAPVFVGGVNLGGAHVTNDIAFILNKPKVIAEQVKCDFGNCHIPSVGEDESILIPQIGGLPSIRMPKKELSKVIEPRMAEIFSMLQVELEKKQIRGSFGGGVVLVGGGALLSGATELASEIFRLPARIGFPEALHGLDRTFINPKYTTVLGLIMHEAKRLREIMPGTGQRQDSSKHQGGIGKKIKGFFKTIF